MENLSKITELKDEIENWIDSQDINNDVELVQQAIDAVESNNQFKMQMVFLKIEKIKKLN